jgi:hypothetical protein
VRRSFFQRRAGLATLIATTAAGRHRYSIPDVPVDEAWRIADEVLVRTPWSTRSWIRLATAHPEPPGWQDPDAPWRCGPAAVP